MKCLVALLTLLCVPVMAQSSAAAPVDDDSAPEPKLSDTLGTAELLLLKLPKSSPVLSISVK